MPTESEKDIAFYLKTENEYHRIGSALDIPSIEPAEALCEGEPITVSSRPVEFPFEFRPTDNLTSHDIFLVLTGFCTLAQVMCNNWRKMHGLPMKRRMRNRKIAKN